MTPVKTQRANLGRKGTVAVPKGWRKLKSDESIRTGDKYLCGGKWWLTCGTYIHTPTPAGMGWTYIRRRAARSKGRVK